MEYGMPYAWNPQTTISKLIKHPCFQCNDLESSKWFQPLLKLGCLDFPGWKLGFPILLIVKPGPETNSSSHLKDRPKTQKETHIPTIHF